MVPACFSPPSRDDAYLEKDDLSALKAGLRKVKTLTELVSTKKTKKMCPEDEGSEGRSSRSEDVEYAYSFDTDSLDDDPDEGELEDGKEGSSIRKSFSYGSLAAANCVGGSLYFDMNISGEFEDWVYYSHWRSDVGPYVEDTTSPSLLQTSKKSILPWKKRKLNFRSPKAKGEPLLKKSYGEEGGDDIDYDRRQLSSSDESLSLGWHMVGDDLIANSLPLSNFGDDNFAVGSWELKEVVSRDGHMKLSTQVFFASIDQRSERAAGESACTALVAVIANWFQFNHNAMPIKPQFDILIHEGSLEWRNLCENATYRERFPDKHFDLETVLQAKIRPLSVVSGKSFIGFFHPEGMEENSDFDFLHGVMSFDNIWDEISRARSECTPDGCLQLYVVSWNDHFFVLKVESDAYYIVDTLGERLYEGCSQAYILKFDESTSIHKSINAEEKIVCKGKESCKEYIKSFLAAIPLRELEDDIKKGRIGSTPLHHRLQIEFHYTEPAEDILPAAVEPVLISVNEEYIGQEVLLIADSAVSDEPEPTMATVLLIVDSVESDEPDAATAAVAPKEEFLSQEDEAVLVL